MKRNDETLQPLPSYLIETSDPQEDTLSISLSSQKSGIVLRAFSCELSGRMWRWRLQLEGLPIVREVENIYACVQKFSPQSLFVLLPRLTFFSTFITTWHVIIYLLVHCVLTAPPWLSRGWRWGRARVFCFCLPLWSYECTELKLRRSTFPVTLFYVFSGFTPRIYFDSHKSLLKKISFNIHSCAHIPSSAHEC